MDDKKLKNAFFRVKTDMDALGNDVSQIRMQVADLARRSSLSDDISEQIKKLDSMDVDKFTDKMEREFASINKLIQEFNHSFRQASEFIKKHQEEVEKYNNELADLRKRTKETHSKTENTNLDVSMMNARLAELSEMVSEKIDLEINSLRLEFTGDIARIYDNIESSKDHKKESTPKKKEVKKVEKKKTTTKKNPPSPPKLEAEEEEKQDGKFKKAVKWLFVDEDDDETFNDIKGEVKKGEKL